MRKRIILPLVALAGLYLWNASWLADAPDTPRLSLIAHRGVHQTFNRAGLTSETCTAERIFPPEHEFIENTLPSMEAAFAAGADVVELDIHPTTDGKFAVMHDWTLDCRTDGSGVTRKHDMATLKTLDVGFGYTADNGKTFPLRGKGVGMMPSLEEVMDHFPEGRFLVNFKSRDENEGRQIAEMLDANPRWRERIMAVYGGDEPVEEAKRRISGLQGYGKKSALKCLGFYAVLGWSGYVPAECRDTLVPVPANFAPWLWGWPNRFQARVHEAGSSIILLGPASFDDPGSTGIDTLDQLELIPPDFSGYLWTNHIEVIGPAMATGRR